MAALVTSERSRPGARSEAAKKEEAKGGRGADRPGRLDMMAPDHGGRLYGGNRGREGDFSGGAVGAARDSPVVRRAWCETQGVDFIGGFRWALGVN